MSKRTRCPDCSEEGKLKNNVGVYEDGKMYCFRCEKLFVSDEVEDEFVYIDADTCETDFEITKKKLTEETVKAFDVCLRRNIKIRGPGNKNDVGRKTTYIAAALEFRYGDASKLKSPDKNYLWVNHNKKLPMWGERLHDSSRKNIIITEGEEDAMAVWQCLGHGSTRSFNHVTSIPAGVGSAVDFVKQHYEKLVQYDTITLCFDMDDKGQQAVEKVIPMFSKNKLRITKLSEKDACDMLIANKSEELKWSVLKAEAIIPKGIVRMSDLTDEFFDYEPPLGIELEFPLLNKALNGLRRGELTMVAAGSGIGKSVLTSNIIYDMVVDKGLKVVDIKLEEDKKKTIFNYAGMYFNDRKYANHPRLMNEQQRAEFRDVFKNYITHDHFGSLDSKELLSVLEYYALSEKVDFIFLDHISIAISGTQSSKEGERKDIDILVTKIRELINTSNVGFVCVSHLSNPNNNGQQWEEGRKVNRSALRGSGALAQLSDNIIGLEGNLLKEEEKEQRLIRLLKTRYGIEQEATCDRFTYDKNTGKIHVVVDFQAF